ncbi:MAG: hypothetical protein ACFE9T_07040 [Promethearchaeota archaeon]
MSILSAFLAEMSTHDLQTADHIDHIDHIDLGHLDHVDLGHVDHIDHVDHVDLGHVDHIDHVDLSHPDHTYNIDDSGDSGILNDTTPAPFMLLFSTSLLLFGISGILFYYLFANEVKFLMFFSTLGITYLITKFISIAWQKIAKSRYYKISSTENLIGLKGIIVLDVDNRGGVIKVSSNTPMKFEKLHVKPLNLDSSFKRGEEVYICDVKDGFLLVDNKVSSIRYRWR